MPQPSIPFMLIRGGSSKGVFLDASDIPTEISDRDRLLLAIMEGVGQGDKRQVDGLGGGDSLTSKVAIVGPSSRTDADLDYLFVQIVIGKGLATTAQECGNILAGVLPYALEKGWVQAGERTTTATVHMVNTGSLCEVMVLSPGGKITYAGDAKVDGVPGTGAAIVCNYLDVAGSNCGALFPTGNLIDVFDGIRVSCIDNGMPCVILRAEDFGITAYESKEELDANDILKARLESIRLQAGKVMNLGDVTHKTVPKMCLLAPPIHGGFIHTRTFIPHTCHSSIGVLGAVSVAAACLIQGTVADGLQNLDNSHDALQIEHPSGEMTVSMTLEHDVDGIKILQSGVIRTARPIASGVVFLPESF